MKGDDAHQWQDAARAEMQNFERHGVYVEVSEDQLPSWNSSTRRAHEVIDMMWVLRIKKDEKGDLLKYKARAVVCGNQQKRKATALARIRAHARNVCASRPLSHIQTTLRSRLPCTPQGPTIRRAGRLPPRHIPR
eukprot:1609754-Pleurochrysis_carterae.AAC.1